MAYSRVCSAYNEDQEATRFLYREEILCINKFLNCTEKDIQMLIQLELKPHKAENSKLWIFIGKAGKS